MKTALTLLLASILTVGARAGAEFTPNTSSAGASGTTAGTVDVHSAPPPSSSGGDGALVPSWAVTISNGSQAGLSGVQNTARDMRGWATGTGRVGKDMRSMGRAYESTGGKLAQMGEHGGIFDWVSTVSGMAGAAAGGDAVGVVQEGTNGVLSGGFAAAGGWGGGKAGAIIGGSIGGPPGMLIGGGVGALVGSMAGAFGYEWYVKPHVDAAGDQLSTALINSQPGPERPTDHGGGGDRGGVRDGVRGALGGGSPTSGGGGRGGGGAPSGGGGMPRCPGH